MPEEVVITNNENILFCTSVKVSFGYVCLVRVIHCLIGYSALLLTPQLYHITTSHPRKYLMAEKI